MNINLSTVTDSPKVTKTTAMTEISEASEETQSEGFFSKLSSFIKGDSTSEGKSAKAEDGEVVEASADKPLKGKAESTESASADELLTQDNSKAVKAETSDAESDEPQQKSAKLEKDEKVEPAPLVKSEKTTSSEAEKIIADSDEVLKRLDQSNSALQAKDGKPLPQQSEAQTNQTANLKTNTVSDAEDSTPVNLQKVPEQSVPQQDVVSRTVAEELDAPEVQNSRVTAQETVPQQTSRQIESEGIVEQQGLNKGEAVVIPAAAQRFVQTESDPQPKQLVGQASDSKEAAVASGVTLTAAATQTSVSDEVLWESKAVGQKEMIQQQVVTEGESEAAKVVGQKEMIQQQVVTEDEAELLKMAESNLAEEQITEAALTTKAVEESNAASPEVAAIAAAGTKVATEAKVDVKAASTPKSQTVLQTAASSASDVSSASIEAPVAAGVMAAAAIPWAVNSSEEVASDEVVLKSSSQLEPKAQQAAVAQSVHQALAQSQTAQVAAQQNAAALAPTQVASPEVMASQMQTLVNAPVNTPVNPAVAEQAMLKAAMSAKSVGGLTNGSTAKNESGLGQGSEPAFAQQLAQAAGLQQSSPGQVRAEQAAQVPLQMNREMASDQVAERVQMMLSKNLKNIDIRLDPPELGRMQIRMNMNGDGATVHFTVANQQARDALEQSMPRLREMLAQQGVQLGDTSVQQQASGQQQNRYAANGQGQSGQGSSNQAGMGEENLEPDINLDLNVAAKRDGISYYA
ncbi:flagellar hook-length control protein FliK [Vibrio atypicus]|uniref:flagellar hook-length control protein FliK n=1 Tax=Vibrio atypicus TaxID=558271 RepID=UPI001359E1AA|nr:flagellar hook-length control protein FliK [Vibrio atypicus]